jgi:hypothetical protein
MYKDVSVYSIPTNAVRVDLHDFVSSTHAKRSLRIITNFPLECGMTNSRRLFNLGSNLAPKAYLKRLLRLSSVQIPNMRYGSAN